MPNPEGKLRRALPSIPIVAILLLAPVAVIAVGYTYWNRVSSPAAGDNATVTISGPRTDEVTIQLSGNRDSRALTFTLQGTQPYDVQLEFETDAGRVFSVTCNRQRPEPGAVPELTQRNTGSFTAKATLSAGTYTLNVEGAEQDKQGPLTVLVRRTFTPAEPQ